MVFVFLLVAGCGAPGDPVPPSPPVPVAINDLAAQQAGDGVRLSFTLPVKTVRGERLSAAPAVEILRGALKPDGSPDPKSFRAVYTIPGAMTDNYLSAGHMQFTDPIAPEETKSHPGALVAYLIRTRASQKRASADSNIVSLRLFPVPERISSLDARVTESAIELNWPAPARTSAGDPIATVPGFHIYRGELDPSSSEAAAHDLAQAKWKTKLALLASSDANNYRDTSFEFGKTYLYLVRSFVLEGTSQIESADSASAIATPRDVFPPAAPQNVVAAVLPGATPETLQVDLSWSLNLETRLAGYHVYRSEQEGTRGQLVTPDLLLSPTVRDTSVEPGHRYWYTVTAVSRAGNESAPSAPIVVDVTQPLP